MAIIGEIRKRPTLILVIIGLALLAFVLGEAIAQQFGGGGDDEKNITIDGESIDPEQEEMLRSFNTFWEKRIQENKRGKDRSLTAFDQRGAAKFGWLDFAETMMVEKQNELLGIETSDEELELLFFKGDTMQVYNYMVGRLLKWDEIDTATEKGLDLFSYGKLRYENPQRRLEIRAMRQKDKYVSLLRSGFYATNLEAERDFAATNDVRKIKYAYKAFSELPSDKYIPSDEEIKAYYKAHKTDPQYRIKAGKVLKVVTVNMEPSEKNKTDQYNILNNTIKKNFANVPLISDSLFAAQYKGVKKDPFGRPTPVVVQMDSSRFVNSFPKEYYDSVFSLSNDTTMVFGPYELNGTYNLLKARVHHKRRVRHILIKPRDNYDQETFTLLDSIYNTVKEDTSMFAKLAQENSIDPGSAANGGDMGFIPFEGWVAPFARYAFTAEVGDVGVVRSQFGYHIMNITDEATDDSSKFVTTAILSKQIMAQGSTVAKYKDEAKNFSVDSYDYGLETLADSLGYTVNDLKVSETDLAIQGYEEITPLYKFFKDGVAGDVSSVYSIKDKNQLIVVKIEKSYEDGPMDEESALEQMKTDLINEKKAEQLKNEISGKSDLASIAQIWGVQIANKDLRFGDASIAGIRQTLDNPAMDDPELYAVGAVFGKDVNDGGSGMLDDVLVGKEGIYMVQVLSEQKGEGIDYATVKERLRTKYSNSISSIADLKRKVGLYYALKKYIDVQDNR